MSGFSLRSEPDLQDLIFVNVGLLSAAADRNPIYIIFIGKMAINALSSFSTRRQTA